MTRDEFTKAAFDSDLSAEDAAKMIRTGVEYVTTETLDRLQAEIERLQDKATEYWENWQGALVDSAEQAAEIERKDAALRLIRDEAGLDIDPIHMRAVVAALAPAKEGE